MFQNKSSIPAEKKEKILKLIKISSVVFPAILLTFAFIILPNLSYSEKNEFFLIQIALVIASIIEIFSLKLVAALISKE